ncbi:MAG TPA: type II secretion system protein GspE [Actinobacteria bacterium]|nr:type II secretion system protein GspE [Actinomycetota bacterium]
MSSVSERIGLFLVRAGTISTAQLADAIQVHRVTGLALTQVIIEMGYSQASAILPKLARQLGIEFVDLNERNINVNAVSVLPEDLARRYTVLPVDFVNGKLLLMMSAPDDVLAIDDIQMATGYEVIPAVGIFDDIAAGVNQYYKMAETLTDDLLLDGAASADLEGIAAVSEEAPINKLINFIISQAVNDRASDIHIEPQEKDLRVRYRIDGVLQEIMTSPKKAQSAIISSLKLMSSMDIAEVRKPQDGRCSLSIKGRVVDFRVATLPTVYGERVVLRVLEKDSILLKLDDLGFLPQSQARYESAFTRPYGAILVTGPTGSGKSTTLYATLNVLNTEAKNIVTIEDPVEYRLPGINQIQINSRAGLSFSRGLRSILRASPDILMVGEIRDRETAQIAIEAALTGHLVLSTLHTNDAPGAISRLTEMGVAPFLIASAIDCVQAQRLARRLCPDCKEPYSPDNELLEKMGVEEAKGMTLYRPKGCSKCNDAGFKGRVGLYEVMLVSEEIEQLTVERATVEEIKKVAIKEGMQTLREDGIAKVLKGDTSYEEILRVVV